MSEFDAYIRETRMDEVEIRFFVEVDGHVSSVVFMQMPEPSDETDEKFREAVREALLSMPRWHRASVWGKPVSALISTEGGIEIRTSETHAEIKALGQDLKFLFRKLMRKCGNMRKISELFRFSAVFRITI